VFCELDSSIIKPCSPAPSCSACLHAGQLSASDCVQSILLKSSLPSQSLRQLVFCKETFAVSQQKKGLRPQPSTHMACATCN